MRGLRSTRAMSLGTTRPRVSADQATGSPAADAAAPWTLLINPRSFHLSQRDRVDRLESLAQHAGVHVARVDDHVTVATALDTAIQSGSHVVAIAGGDGTIQAAVTHLATVSDTGTASIPALMVLGGGRTNLTAQDFSASGGPLAVFERAHKSNGTLLSIVRRRALTLQQTGRPPVSGFFVAGALIDQLIRDCHTYRSSGDGLLHDGWPSTGWFLLRSAVLACVGKYRFSPSTMQVDAGALGTLDGPVSLFACTTLAHDTGLLNPYAARGDGDLRITAVRAGASGFWWRLPRILRGRYTDAMSVSTGYLSGRSQSIRIDGLRSVTVDGQEQELDPRSPVTITPGPEFRFLQP